MDKLKFYLSGLGSESLRRLFAEQCGTTINYLRKIQTSGQILPPLVCIRIERLSRGAVKREDLHPDACELWPDVAKRARKAIQKAL